MALFQEDDADLTTGVVVLVIGGSDLLEGAQGCIVVSGGEQGDALMPALFSLALGGALKLANEELEAGELAFAFLADVYLIVRRARAKQMFDHFANLI